jgi:hypothetical protein
MEGGKMTIPTRGTIRLTGDVQIESTVRLTGDTTISGGTIINAQRKPFAEAIYVPPGIKLDIDGTTFRNAEWKQASGEWTCNRALVVDGAATLVGVTVVEGFGVEVPRGQLLWFRGGGVGLQRYLVKTGDADNDQNVVAKSVTLENLTCSGSTTEAVVRTQGCNSLSIRNCTLLQRDAVGRHDKGALALRLVRSCIISGGEYDTLELGWRTPVSVGASDEKFGATHPCWFFIDGATINGSIRICGNSAAAVQSCTFSGLDRRGFGEKVAMIEQTHKVWRGEIIQDSCAVPQGWKIGDGVSKKSDQQRRWMQIFANANAGQ